MPGMNSSYPLRACKRFVDYEVGSGEATGKANDQTKSNILLTLLTQQPSHRFDLALI